MALKQGKFGGRGSEAINPREAGSVVAVVYEFDFTSVGYTAASDVLELGPLPAYAKPINVVSIGEGLGATTATIGLLTGEAGNPDNARALAGASTNFLTAASVNDTEVAATKVNCLKVASAQSHRGIGATLAGNIAAGAGKKLRLLVEYIY